MFCPLVRMSHLHWEWCVRVAIFDFLPMVSIKSTNMDKSLTTLLRFWGVFQFTQIQSLPSPHKQCWTRVSRIFSEFQLCIGWGRENCKKISKRMHCFKREPRNDRKIWILQYCPKDFFQDCLNPGFEENEVCFLHFPTLFRHFGDK